MGFRINTNIAAMAAHNNATLNNRAMDSSLSRLSSGLRISQAADDSSGMVIANSLRSQASSLGQAINNGNDAIGLIQTADGALDEYSKILNTIKTKSLQAASDGQNTNSRLAIQKDIDRLMENLGNIAKTTTFNGQQLLAGGFTNKEFQIGANSNESAKVSIGSTETTKVGLTTRSTLDMVSPSGGAVSLNVRSSITGEEIQMKKIDIAFNNQQQNGMGALADEINKYSGDTGMRAKAVVESSTGGAISAGSTGADFAINGVAIGAVIVADNDNSGALLSAINSKTSLTGVAATMNQDGSMKLSSADGRAIKVDGDVSAVFGTSNAGMSTIGHLELVQSGASEFQITNKSVGAMGFDMLMSAATVTTNVDSTIAAGSSLVTGTIFKQGSTMGGDTTIDAVASYNEDTFITEGSTLTSGAMFKEGTTLGGDVTGGITAGTMQSDTLLAAGSVVKSGSVFSAGTVVTTEFTSGSDVFRVGEVLAADVTTDADLTLAADMTIKSSSTASLNAGTVFNTGSTVGGNLTSTLDTILEKDMTLKSGSSTAATTILKAGSVVGSDVTTTAAVTVLEDINLKAGSTIAAASTIAAGSTLGGKYTTDGDTVLQSDMSVKSGSTLNSGTILKAGTTMQQDTTTAQTGTAYKAGEVLTQDVTLDNAIVLTKDMTMLEGSTLASASILAANDGKAGTINLGTTTNSALADIDVTTLEGAMKAMDTLDAAIKDLDSVRSDLGSVQNQIVSTINNISVTQVNVKAAESQLRDVDFAAESANFSRLNILAQSGSYAMSQANAVQQNVLRLLQ